MKKSVNN